MGMSYEELGLYGRLRKITRCGPVAMFRQACQLWRESHSPQQVADKVRRGGKGWSACSCCCCCSCDRQPALCKQQKLIGKEGTIHTTQSGTELGAEGAAAGTRRGCDALLASGISGTTGHPPIPAAAAAAAFAIAVFVRR
jgi:hypothetical protein